MLELVDAPLMLEWMHDLDVVKNMKTNFVSKSLDDCLLFIKQAQNTSENLHLAIADETNIYMGTVSLKHIKNNTAEFGITVRKCAMGLGYSSFGMEQILKMGFNDLNLDTVFWCVFPKNERAVRFYDKNGYERCKCPKNVSCYSTEEIEQFIWYSVNKHEFELRK